LFKGLIVTGPDCAGLDCAGPDSVGPDCAGPDRTCTKEINGKNIKIIFQGKGHSSFIQERNWTFDGLRLDRSTALYIYKAKNCELLVLFTQAQKTKFIFK
jgi:hypothetical protein